MYELLEYLEKFKKNLDSLNCIKEIEKNISTINNNEELKKYLNKYYQTPNENLKQQIYQFEEFKDYKRNENNVNFIILEINSKLKKIIVINDCNMCYK